MFILVANLGSTSFKFKLLDMDSGGAEVARGAFERIGQKDSPHKNHGDVLDAILESLPHKPDAIGFKAVHGGPISGAVRVSDEVLATMEEFADVAPLQSTLHRGDARVQEKIAQRPAGGGRLKRRSIRPFRCRGRCTSSRMTGPRDSAFADMDFTARAIALSPRGCLNWSARRTRAGSFRVIGLAAGVRDRKR